MVLNKYKIILNLIILLCKYLFKYLNTYCVAGIEKKKIKAVTKSSRTNRKMK